MNSPTAHQRWIPGVSKRAAGIVVALMVMLATAITVTQSAEAQYREGVIYAFTSGGDGGFPQSPSLALDDRFNLYGVYVGGENGGPGMVYKVAGNTKTVLYSFTGGADGARPGAGLLFAHGTLYGTTIGGGAVGQGTVYMLDLSGKQTVLHSFTGGTDGANPEGVLLRDKLGNLYGTTVWGGASGQGTVFKIDATGLETVLYSFTGTDGDGANPYAGLVRDSEGNLYGTTYGGGAYGVGTVFKLDTTGNETVLHSFTGTSGDGANPNPGLVRDKQGNLYGTTAGGGISCIANMSGCGTVFKVDTAGNETVLHAFAFDSWNGDGATPYAGLVLDKYGNLYGTTFFGGDWDCNYQSSYPGCGTVFKVDGAGRETVMYTFSFMGQYGANPWAGLAQDKNGNLYGTTYIGGYIEHHMGAPCWPVGCGTVFGIAMGSATSITLSSSANPSDSGQTVFFNAAVISSAGAPPDGEDVAFLDGTTVLGTGTLCCGGLATFDTSTLPLGVREIKAVYGGNPGLVGSASKKLRQVVRKAATQVALTTSQSPVSVYDQVTFTATVTSADGTFFESGALVIFYRGTTAVCAAWLSGGTAVCGTDFSRPGDFTISAVFPGDETHKPSVGKVAQIVNKASSSTSLYSSPNPSVYGQPVTLSAYVSTYLPPSGYVHFMDGTTRIGSARVDNWDAAILTRSKLTVGRHALTAVYVGDLQYEASTSNVVEQVVQ